MISSLKFYVKLVLKKSFRKEIFDMANSGIAQKNLGKHNGDTKIMILRRNNTAVGVFSDYIVFLGQIERAISTGYVPIIDRKTIKNDFFPADDNVNTWEVFFEQPMYMRLEDVDETMDIYINNMSSAIFPISIMHCKDNVILNFWREVARKYIRLNSKMSDIVEKYFSKFMNNRRVLGIAVREGYKKLSEQDRGKVAAHPIQATTLEMLELAKKFSREWNCEYVYITCQTAETVDLFRKEFGDKTLIYPKDRPTYQNLLEGSSAKLAINKVSAEQHEVDYVAEMALLAKCTSMLCSENSGAEGAFIMSEGFEHFFCVEKGNY